METGAEKELGNVPAPFLSMDAHAGKPVASVLARHVIMPTLFTRIRRFIA
jgi:hypothetical protein